MYQTITATELKQLLSNDTQINLVDVRTPAEYREVHVQQARNIPLARVTPEYVQADRQNSASSAVYIICRSGARGKQACEKLINSGLTNVINVEGGTMACVAAGIPVIRGKKSIPLHCQVQIITGLSVMAGILLAVFLQNSYWLLLSLSMGCGLTFSGLTNTCAMGAILTHMPWNHDRGCAANNTTAAVHPNS